MKEGTNYQLSTSVSGGVVEIEISGEITKIDFDRLRTEVIAILREKNAKAVLCDNRALKGPLDIIEAYFRTRSIPVDVKMLPAAIVVLSENGDFQSFYETTAANTGRAIKFFTDLEVARAWLKSRIVAMREIK